MAVNFTASLYGPVYNVFAVDCTIVPIASQPGVPPYGARGIFDMDDLSVAAMDGSIYSDQATKFYIREVEFDSLPLQNDRIIIPIDCNGANLGEYEIVDVTSNGGGETELTLRKWAAPKT